MLFSANPMTRRFGLGEAHPSKEAYLEEFKSQKPCVHGSDAHEPDRLFVPDQDRQLWVRADPGFNGLAQLRNEPEDRVFIGSEPEALARVRGAANKSIKEISFEHRGKPNPAAQWLSGSLPLNPGLIAVIGSKGSGKSALGDALALAGNAHNEGRFSFLTGERFLNPRDHLGGAFAVEIVWRSEERQSCCLDEKPDPLLTARVKHIPQHYLEEICGQIQRSGSRTKFDEELEAVIFSHVQTADRLGKETLRDLLEHMGSAKEAGIEQLRANLAEVNRRYFVLRDQASVETRKTLVAQLEARRADLAAHDQARPAAVAAPDDSEEADPEAREAAEQLAEVVAQIEKCDPELDELAQRQAIAKKRLVAIGRLLVEIKNLQKSVEDFYGQAAEDAKLLNLDPRTLAVLRAEDKGLERQQVEIAREVEELEDALDPDHSESVARSRRDASEKADQLRERLDAPQRRYQEYQRALKQWERTRGEIIGDPAEPGSVTGLEAKLESLDELPEQIEAAAQERQKVFADIFNATRELLGDYERLYRPVQDFINKHPVAQRVPLTLTAESAIDGLEEGLLAMIHHGRRGSFSGEQPGAERLREIIARHDFSTLAGLNAFLAEIEHALTHDLRQSEPESLDLADQLVGHASPEQLYDFLFGLRYLRPRFELRWHDKQLHQLSPGERGTLLLIFYLLIDREKIPLIVDQPEENLDNETITQLLVPALKCAKEQRQIIMITHNPNLAVVCDADQVIHAEIDKAAGNRITYTSGSIEDPCVNQLIIDVLEGTKPAFDLRDAKYDVLERIAA
ncbi:MAG TPA: hypothetical protein VFP17_06730 [Solirubrobacterales bacterium]|nr:hypothetical protein [Solirubrobacterales bacterium]